MTRQRGHFRYCPHHVDGQKFLSKLILTKISAASSQDPAADLARKHVLLFQVAQRHVPQDAMIPVVSIRGQLAIPPPPKVEILYPLAPAALSAMGLSDGSRKRVCLNKISVNSLNPINLTLRQALAMRH